MQKKRAGMASRQTQKSPNFASNLVYLLLQQRGWISVTVDDGTGPVALNVFDFPKFLVTQQKETSFNWDK